MRATVGRAEHSAAVNKQFIDRRWIPMCASKPMTVEGTTANNEPLRVFMGCNGDSQDGLDGESWVLRLDDTSRTSVQVCCAHRHHEVSSAK